MRPSIVLGQLVLWASSTHAFFPYTPTWLKDVGIETRRVLEHDSRDETLAIKQRSSRPNAPHPDDVAQEVARLAMKYAGRRQSKTSRRNRLAVDKRDNKYKIMEANDPQKAMSAGLHQDGTDYSYFVEVELGSKGKKVYMLVDTGAGSSWVMGSDCDSKACALHNTFGPGDSDTMETTKRPFSIAYGSGKVSGQLISDTISVAGMSFNYQFGLASNTSSQFNSFAFDGILGFAMNEGANENFLSTMTKANKLKDNIFCIALSRASDGKNNGEIRFGSTNPDKYEGDISYNALTANEDWTIKIDDMSYDGKKAGSGNIDSYIDTGTSYIFGPKDVVKKIHDVVPGASSSDGTTFNVPCDSDKKLEFTFSGVDYEISPKDWISPKNSAGKCSSNIYGYEVVKGSWLIGDTFLKNVYTVFDKDKKRIGFAQSKTVSAASTTTSKAATSTNGPSKTKSDQAATTDVSVSTMMTQTTQTTQTTMELASSSSSAVSDSEETTNMSKPDFGLIPASKTGGGGSSSSDGSGSSLTADTTQPSETNKDSAASSTQSHGARYAMLFSLLPLFALLA